MSFPRLQIKVRLLVAVAAVSASATGVTFGLHHGTPAAAAGTTAVAPSAVTLPGVSADALNAFGLTLGLPQGSAAVTADAAAKHTVAGYPNWSVVGTPVLSTVTAAYVMDKTAQTKLCWVVVITDPNGFPGWGGPSSHPGTVSTTGIQLVDATTGQLWFLFTGGGLS